MFDVEIIIAFESCQSIYLEMILCGIQVTHSKRLDVLCCSEWIWCDASETQRYLHFLMHVHIYIKLWALLF